MSATYRVVIPVGPFVDIELFAALAQIGRPELTLDIEVGSDAGPADEYELAHMIRDLQNDLADYGEFSIERPRKLRAKAVASE